jgi:phage-related protein
VKNFGSKIKDAVSKIWTAIKTGIENHFKSIYEIGANILQGLINGIKSKISAVTDVVSNVATKISDGFKDFFGISSPSKLFEQYGKFLDEGLAIGVDKNADMVSDEIDKNFDFSDQIVDVTNSQNNATMNTRNIDSIVDLLQQLVDKDVVQISGDAEGIFKLVRKKSNEYYKSNNRSAFA